MTYQQTLTWMFAQLPMYQQKGKTALNHKLDKSIAFDKVLKHPHQKYKCIHVAGTNGKGSSSHMLASILQEAGYKVGLYTSPHLKDFKERIRVNGAPVTEDYVIDFIKKHRNFLDKNKLSFFEMTVGMAFAYYAKEKVDVAVIEVGLGGRLDSTNIINPIACLITNIGFDHMTILGNTLAKIATEKAGIMKPEVPVIISEKQAETTQIFEAIAQAKKAPLHFAQDFTNPAFKTDLLGNYQNHNIIGVLALLKILPQLKISNTHIKKGLLNVVANTNLKGRWQILQEQPKVICDTAHNQQGLQLVLTQLQKEPCTKLHFVLGFVKDKNIETLLALFPKKANYYFVAAKIPRAITAEELLKLATKQNLLGSKHSTVQKGLQMALKHANTNDLIFVGGSTFVVAEVI